MNPKFSNDGNFYSMYPPAPTVPYERQMNADSILEVIILMNYMIVYLKI